MLKGLVRYQVQQVGELPGLSCVGWNHDWHRDEGGGKQAQSRSEDERCRCEME